MKLVVLEVRRTMNGWVVEYPGGEEPFTDGCGSCFTLSTIHTDVSYEFTEENGGELTIRLTKPPQLGVPTKNAFVDYGNDTR